jgi:hypothetical protein
MAIFGEHDVSLDRKSKTPIVINGIQTFPQVGPEAFRHHHHPATW